MKLRVLFVTASVSGERSTSKKLAGELIDRIREQHSGVELVERDLAIHAPPHWGAAQVAAAFTPPEERSQDDKAALSLSDALCDEILRSDIVIVASPMWNFSVPSSLKSWIDHISRVGVTFKYSDQGPVGLLNQLQTVYLIESSGGSYSGGSPTAPLNHLSPYLSTVFRFLGAKSIQTLTVPGTAINPAEALERGRSQLESLLK